VDFTISGESFYALKPGKTYLNQYFTVL